LIASKLEGKYNRKPISIPTIQSLKSHQKQGNKKLDSAERQKMKKKIKQFIVASSIKTYLISSIKLERQP
jgi:hypothetical protein